MSNGWRLVCLVLLIMPLALLAETRVFTEFSYDASGNITGITRSVTDQPPILNSISPQLIRIGRTFTLVASGENLFAAEVIGQDDSVQISNISATDNTVRFDVLATDDTPVGEYAFTISTVLGAVAGSVNVRIPGPDLVVEPMALALRPGQSQTLDIRLTSADSFENILAFSAGSDEVISVTPNTAVIPQGDTLPNVLVTVTALAVGNSSLSINASTLGNAGIPVFVNDGFIPSPDGNDFFAASVSVFRDEAVGRGPFVSGSDGVTVFRDPATEAGPFVTGSDGVTVFRDPATTQGPFVTGSDGITVFRDPATEAGPFVTGSDGVTVFRDPATAAGPFVAQSDDLALLRDNVANGLVPTEIVANNIATVVTINGVGLDAVTNVTVSPAEDITLGVFSVNQTSDELTIPIVASGSAVLGQRQISLTTSNGPLVFRVTDPSTGIFTENGYGVITIISN